MLDAISLDQLRALICVADEGSFSAAARKLRRVQSAISQSMANLEGQLGLTLFDRSTKVPMLTEQGRAVLAAARRVTSEVDALRQLAVGMHGGLEAAVSLCVDALFPLTALIDLCQEFAQAFPAVDLRVDTQTMSAVSARVLAGVATLGVVSPMGLAASLERRLLSSVAMIPVAASEHPLAGVRGPIARAELERHIQIVLSERLDDPAIDAGDAASGVPDQGVLSSRTWRVSDLHTKHELLRAGLGWGNLPHHLVIHDLRAGRLRRLQPAGWAPDEHTLTLSAIYRRDAVFGPAHRWVLDRLQTLCRRDAAVPPGSAAPATRRRGGRTRAAR